MPHPDVATRLARLSADQLAAATAPPGPVLCLAPAGSGKTTTLVARVAWLVDQGVPPATICAVTFNRRAALELSARLAEALAPLGLDARAIRVRTFHALGREILQAAGRPVEPLVDRAELLRELERDAPMSWVQRLDTAFSRLKLELAVDPSELAAEVEAEAQAGRPAGPIIEAFLGYQAELERRGALDFDDLLRAALELLSSDRGQLSRWRDRCRELLVDEVQDLDASQLRLATLLSAPRHHLFLVGDDDQTIYAWRLADVRRLLGLEQLLPGLRRLDLVTNRRCPRPVVERAVRLVEHNQERFPKHIEASPDAMGELLLAPDPGDDVSRARRLLRAWPGPGSAAVLARTNAELAPVAAVALETGLAYAAADDGLLLDHPRLDPLLALAEATLGDRTGREPGHHLALLARMRRDADPEDQLLLSSMLGWAAGLLDLQALRSRIAAAREHRAAPTEEGPARLVLATVHGTKGLEFDHVACIGLDDGRFPNARSLAESAEPARALEEERRLAYVAWTRARRSLILIYDPAAPSSFLGEAFERRELAGLSAA
jgi:superfamily I DNA/RNA helicase